MSDGNPYRTWRVLAGLAILAALPYLRSLALPLIEDDHLQILLGRRYGAVSGWPQLMADVLYRCRATSIIMTHWTEMLAGLSPVVFHLSSLAVHIVNTGLVLSLGSWKLIGWRTSAIAAAFFAVYEGHQEAVIWYAALPELLVFAFTMASFLCWVRWLNSGMAHHRWLAASFVGFVLAVFSKESGAVLVALLALPLVFERERWRKALLAIVPFAAVAAFYFLITYAARSRHLHFNDGTFSLDAPVALTVANSTGRLFWPWGLIALVTLLVLRNWKEWKIVAAAAVWIVLTFLPYSFLTYMPRVPSRHTYLASVGLAVVIATAWIGLRNRFPRRRQAAAAVAAVVLVHNAGYVLTRKHAQFEERAASIVAVVRAAKNASGPVYVHCFPYGFEAAELAVAIETGKPSDTVRLWKGDLTPGRHPEPLLCLNPKAPGPHPVQRRHDGPEAPR